MYTSRLQEFTSRGSSKWAESIEKYKRFGVQLVLIQDHFQTLHHTKPKTFDILRFFYSFILNEVKINKWKYKIYFQLAHISPLSHHHEHIDADQLKVPFISI